MTTTATRATFACLAWCIAPAAHNAGPEERPACRFTQAHDGTIYPEVPPPGRGSTCPGAGRNQGFGWTYSARLHADADACDVEMRAQECRELAARLLDAAHQLEAVQL